MAKQTYFCNHFEDYLGEGFAVLEKLSKFEICSYSEHKTLNFELNCYDRTGKIF